MLSPDYLESVADDVCALYAEWQESVISDMARRIAKMSYASEASVWQMERLEESGFVYNDVISRLAEVTGKSERELAATFKAAGAKNLEYDDSAYRRHGLNPIPIRQSPAMVQLLTAGLKKTGKEIKNLTMTTASGYQTEFIAACDMAYMQVASGSVSHQSAVAAAVKKMADYGGKVIYPSGHMDNVDVAVRRAVRTGVSQTCGMLTEIRLDEMQHDLVETSAHAGARPSHAEWQGQRFSYSGKDRRYPDFYDATGYGSGAGLMGYNCRHSYFPCWEDDPPAYTHEQLEALDAQCITYEGEDYTVYEILQKQRSMERGIRATKRQLAAADGALSVDRSNFIIKQEFAKQSVKLKKQEARLVDMIRQTGFDRRRERESVLGFGRSVSTKAVWANKKELQYLSKEHIIKSITLQDFEKIKGGEISDDVIQQIQQALGADSKYFDDIKIVNKPRIEGEGIDVFVTNITQSGTWCNVTLELNRAFLGGQTPEQINKLIYDSYSLEHAVMRNIDEAVYHETVHAKLAFGKNYAQVNSMTEELSYYHIEGISAVAKKNGEECIAECYVLKKRGEAIPNKEAEELYKKYMEE